MPSRDTNLLHPAMREFAEAFPLEVKRRTGIGVRIICTYRDNFEQARLFAQGRTTDGLIVTRARPGQSPHNVAPAQGSHAIDFAVLTDDGGITWYAPLYLKAAEVARDMGADAGAFWVGFRDMPHIQMPEWWKGKSYPSSYRFMDHSSVTKPAPKPIAPIASSSVRVFHAVTNRQIGAGTLVKDKVYVYGSDPTSAPTSPTENDSSRKVRAFNAATNESLGMATLIGEKVYFLPTQVDGL